MEKSQYDEFSGYTEWKQWTAQSFGQISIADRVNIQAELSAAGVRVTKDTKVLEIGFGNGTLAKWIRETSPHYVGTENNPELIERAKQEDIEAHEATCDLLTIAQKKQFDLIVAFDVIEHLEVPEIITTFRAISECLSTEGLFIFRVPSGDSPFSGPYMYGDITHKTKLGSKAVEQLALMSNLKVISTSDAALPIRGMGARTAFENATVKIARKLVGLFIRLAFHGNKHLVISSNMVAVLGSRKGVILHDKFVR